MGVLNFENADHIILTVKDGISLFEKVNSLLNNEFELEDLRILAPPFDDFSDKITVSNPDVEGRVYVDKQKLDIVDYTDKNVYVATTLSNEAKSEKQILDQQRLIEIALKKNANKVIALSNYFYYARADGESLDLLSRYNKLRENGKKIPDKLFNKIKQRVNSTDDLEIYIKNIMIAGIDAIIAVDLHNEDDVMKFATETNNRFSLSNDMNKFLYNLDTLPLFVHHIKYGLSQYTGINFKLEDMVFSSTDEGSEKRNQRAVSLVDVPKLGEIYCKKVKEEKEDGNFDYIVKVDKSNNIKSLNGKLLVIFDDCAGSFSTISNTVKAVTKQFGKPDYVLACISHPTIYSVDAFRNIRKNKINILTTNTRPNIAYHGGRDFKYISTMDIAPYLHRVIVDCIGTPGEETKIFNEVFNFNSTNLKKASELYSLRPDGKHTQKKLVPYNSQK